MILDKEDLNSGLISQKQFIELANIHAPHCFSIYIPTLRAGEEVIAGQLQQRFKNSIKQLRDIAGEKGLKRKEIVKYVELLETMLEDSNFWRNQSDGLAVFLYDNRLQYFTLPISFDETVYLADHFYLLPLIPLFNDDGKLFVLAFSMQKVRLFEGTRHSIAEVYIDDISPEKLEEVVGYDYEEKSLQHRSSASMQRKGEAMFHGQGRGKDYKKSEVEKFLRAVDAGIMNLLNREDAPLVLACIDRYFPVYKSITSYSNLFDKHIGGNPDIKDSLLLHEEAWMILSDYFRGQREKKTEQFRTLSSGGKTSASEKDIVTASVDGRIDTLFLVKGKDSSGYFDPQKREIIKEREAMANQVSIYNLAVINTIENGGRVFLTEPEDMPLAGTEINALFRY